MNTPIAYSGIIRCTLARKMTTRTMAAIARPTTPFENTRRSPRFWNCRGKNPCSAMMAASRGKPLKLVFDARIRMAMVAICNA